MVFSKNHSAYDGLTRITKADKDFARELDFENIKFSAKSETFTKLKKKLYSNFDWWK